MKSTIEHDVEDCVIPRRQSLGGMVHPRLVQNIRGRFAQVFLNCAGQMFRTSASEPRKMPCPAFQIRRLSHCLARVFQPAGDSRVRFSTIRRVQQVADVEQKSLDARPTAGTRSQFHRGPLQFGALHIRKFEFSLRDRRRGEQVHSIREVSPAKVPPSGNRKCNVDDLQLAIFAAEGVFIVRANQQKHARSKLATDAVDPVNPPPARHPEQFLEIMPVRGQRPGIAQPANRIVARLPYFQKIPEA
jgi:hypothetical protein